jgi:hypothetical protein
MHTKTVMIVKGSSENKTTTKRKEKGGGAGALPKIVAWNKLLSLNTPAEKKKLTEDTDVISVS